MTNDSLNVVFVWFSLVGALYEQGIERAVVKVEV